MDSEEYLNTDSQDAQAVQAATEQDMDDTGDWTVTQDDNTPDNDSSIDPSQTPNRSSFFPSFTAGIRYLAGSTFSFTTGSTVTPSNLSTTGEIVAPGRGSRGTRKRRSSVSK